VLDHDFGWDDGLICGGKVEIVIVPGVMNSRPDFWRRLAARTELVQWGVAEDFSIVEALSDTTNPDGHDELLYRESVSPRFNLWVAGAGHVAAAVAPLARQVDFAVTIFDDRPALASHANFPADCELRVGPWDELLATEPSLSPTFGLIVTRGHNHDALVLSRWISHDFAFLGMIGSRRKKRIIFERLLADGTATREQLERVACPVGIDIQSVTVDEIAMSIVAQLIQRRAAAAGLASGGRGRSFEKQNEGCVAVR
jgi:xanthine dehydrogenase accessory factor